jgi:lysophospholipase L1-like esterase
MQRVVRPEVRRALRIATLGLGLVACTRRADRSPVDDAAKPSASEWIGERSAAEGGAPALDAAAHAPRDSWVLHVGDSFVEASFNQNLWPHFHAAGTRYIVRARTATYTTTWANDAEFDDLLARRPSLVIVTLGANEFDITAPEQHGRAIEAIARKVARAGASCVWTSPPMWTRDTGIVQVIRDHCAPCLFFDSDAVLGGLSPAERKGDRIHPNARGGARWADAFWAWLVRHRDPDAGPWVLVPFEPRGT